MENINLGVFDIDKQYAAPLGKKGTSTDYTIYNYKGPESYLCAYEPTNYPEKLQPLIYCALMTDYAVLVPHSLTAELGEMIVLLNSLEAETYVDFSFMEKEAFAGLVKGTALENYKEAPSQGPASRDFFATFTPKKPEGSMYVPIDSAFAVKSVGTVALGQVYGASVKVHEELEVFPTGKKCAVRSLQVHDEDVAEAIPGSRVGLALKGLDAGEIERGNVIAAPGMVECAKSFVLEAKVSRFFKGELKALDIIFLACAMNYTSVRILEIERNGEAAKMKLETVNSQPVAFPKGAKIVLAKPEAKMRIIGAAKFAQKIA